MKHLHYLLFSLLFISCNKDDLIKCICDEDTVIEIEKPGDFTVKVVKISDTKIKLSWTNADIVNNDSIFYEIGINDSIIAYDLRENSYVIKRLNPDTEYFLNISALNKNRDKKTVSLYVTTLKTFIYEVYEFISLYPKILFEQVSKTSDFGLLVSIVSHDVNSHSWLPTNALLKVNCNYNTEWYKEWKLGRITKITELSGGDYLIISAINDINSENWAISKIDYSGNIKWTYYITNVTISSATELSDGSILTTGEINHSSESPVRIQYYIAKISISGQKIWEQSGGTALYNRPADITSKPDRNIFIFGTSENHQNWLLELDEEGNFINQNTYTNIVQGSDVPKKIIKLNTGGYILATSTSGYFDLNSSSFRIRLTNINSNGDVIWDKYYGRTTNTGIGQAILGDIELRDDNTILLLTNSRNAINFLSLNLEGDILWDMPLSSCCPGCIVTYDKDDKLVTVVGNDGYNAIVRFNPDGYIETDEDKDEFNSYTPQVYSLKIN